MPNLVPTKVVRCNIRQIVKYVNNPFAQHELQLTVGVIPSSFAYLMIRSLQQFQFRDN